MNIRLLKASEIECRIGSCKASGMSLLLYKDARVDQKILDEVYGPTNWKREHKVMGTPVIVKEKDKLGKEHEAVKGQYFSCIVSVWDQEKKCWISKEDTGNESNTDEIKGLYSDSFKRACVNFGIGRELYTAPFIWIASSKGYDKYEKFKVSEIGYNDDREINRLVIVDSKGNKCYEFGNKAYVNNKSNNNESKQVNNQAKTVKENKKPVENTSPFRLLNKEEKEKLFLCAKGIDVNKVMEILKEFGFGSSGEVTRNKLESICEAMEKAKK